MTLTSRAAQPAQRRPRGDRLGIDAQFDDRGAAARWRESCETALFESGRPVLLASADAPKTIGKVVVVAWNGSTESARTIAFGMPLLMGAERVEVLSVEDI